MLLVLVLRLRLFLSVYSYSVLQQQDVTDKLDLNRSVDGSLNDLDEPPTTS